MKSPKPAKPKPDKTQSAQPQPEPSPQEALAKAQADAEHWGAIAAQPNLSPEAAAWAFNLARSARASATLWGKALQAPAPQQGDPMLRSLLNLGAPTPSPRRGGK
jgi:hypothetical protein